MMYYSFNAYLKERFHKKVYKICVDAGFTCPNRDGTKGINGCIYCNNDAFTIVRRNCIKPDSLSSEPAGSANDTTNIPLPSLEQQIEQGKKKLAARYKAEAFILYFQPYSNTYASLQKLKQAYDYVYYDNDIVGLSIGTRPDCVNEEILTLIEAYAKDREICIEYGLESSHNKTLQVINRGHTWEDFLHAVQMTSSRPIKICVHVIFGLPGESRSDMLETVRRISRLPIHAIKFHPLHIVKGSVLYERGKLEDGIWKVKLPECDAKEASLIEIKLLSMDEYVSIVCDALALLPPGIIIQRLTGESSADLLVAPDWIKDKQLVLRKIKQGTVGRGQLAE